MIVKEADPVPSKSRRARAGARAEQDMSFYLRRAFAERDDVWVFHDLRLAHKGEFAQIDHLVLHRHGLAIIESKSVSGEIHITPGGQFIRHYGNDQRKGMPSPVVQARRQGDLLRKLLQANWTSLRDRKLLGVLQGGFQYCPIEVYVSVSDKGIIEGEAYAPQVRKADLIPAEIDSRIKAHARGSSLLNLDASGDDGAYRFNDAELKRVREFLVAQHRPTTGAKKPNTPAEAVADEVPSTVPRSALAVASPPRPQFLCSKCHSLKLRILHGKYGYYFKCDECGGNTWIDTRIDGADRKGRIRKGGAEFFLVSPDGGETLLFVNPQ